MRSIGRGPQRTLGAHEPHHRPGAFAPMRRCASLPMPCIAMRSAPSLGAKSSRSNGSIWPGSVLKVQAFFVCVNTVRANPGAHPNLTFRNLLSVLRALPGQIEPFDRDDFAPRLGALRMAMRGIGKDAQRRLGAKAPGLWWGSWPPRVRCGPRPIHRIALRTAPTLEAHDHPSN